MRAKSFGIIFQDYFEIKYLLYQVPTRMFNKLHRKGYDTSKIIVLVKKLILLIFGSKSIKEMFMIPAKIIQCI